MWTSKHLLGCQACHSKVYLIDNVSRVCLTAPALLCIDPKISFPAFMNIKSVICVVGSSLYHFLLCPTEVDVPPVPWCHSYISIPTNYCALHLCVVLCLAQHVLLHAPVWTRIRSQTAGRPNCTVVYLISFCDAADAFGGLMLTATTLGVSLVNYMHNT